MLQAMAVRRARYRAALAADLPDEKDVNRDTPAASLTECKQDRDRESVQSERRQVQPRHEPRSMEPVQDTTEMVRFSALVILLFALLLSICI